LQQRCYPSFDRAAERRSAKHGGRTDVLTRAAHRGRQMAAGTTDAEKTPGAGAVRRGPRDLRGRDLRLVHHNDQGRPLRIGEKDDWMPAEPCRQLAETARRAGQSVAIKVYPSLSCGMPSAGNPLHTDTEVNADRPGDSKLCHIADGHSLVRYIQGCTAHPPPTHGGKNEQCARRSVGSQRSLCQ
jgi:hypothetical protein